MSDEPNVQRDALIARMQASALRPWLPGTVDKPDPEDFTVLGATPTPAAAIPDEGEASQEAIDLYAGRYAERCRQLAIAQAEVARLTAALGEVRNEAYKHAANIVGPERDGEYSWLANRIRVHIRPTGGPSHD